jgi:hypothetical protein
VSARGTAGGGPGGQRNQPTEEAAMEPLTIGIIVAVVSWVVLTLLAAFVREVWRFFVQFIRLLVQAMSR